MLLMSTQAAMVIAVDRMLVDKNPLDGVAYNQQVRHQSRVSQVMKSVAGSIYTLLCWKEDIAVSFNLYVDSSSRIEEERDNQQMLP